MFIYVEENAYSNKIQYLEVDNVTCFSPLWKFNIVYDRSYTYLTPKWCCKTPISRQISTVSFLKLSYSCVLFHPICTPKVESAPSFCQNLVQTSFVIWLISVIIIPLVFYRCPAWFSDNMRLPVAICWAFTEVLHSARYSGTIYTLCLSEHGDRGIFIRWFDWSGSPSLTFTYIQPEDSIWLLLKWADTAFWLYTA